MIMLDLPNPTPWLIPPLPAPAPVVDERTREIEELKAALEELLA